DKIWTNPVVCSRITGTRAEIRSVIMPIRSATTGSTPIIRGARQEWMFDTNASNPKMMNKESKIEINSCTLDETTKYSARAKPAPMVSIKPVLIGWAMGRSWVDSGVSVTESLAAVMGVVGYSSGSGTVNWY